MKELTKGKKNKIIIAIIAFNFLLSLYFWDKLPEVVPTKWNFQGEVNQYGPKWHTLLLFPLIALFIHFGMTFLPKIDPLKKNYEKFREQYNNTKLLLVAFFSLLFFVILFASLPDKSFNIASLMPFAFGLFLIILGYLTPQFRRNWFLGFRTPWTLSSDKVWKKTHEFAGKTVISAGIVIIITSFLPVYSFNVFMVAFFFAFLAPVVYSYFLWRREKH